MGLTQEMLVRDRPFFFTGEGEGWKTQKNLFAAEAAYKKIFACENFTTPTASSPASVKKNNRASLKASMDNSTVDGNSVVP